MHFTDFIILGIILGGFLFYFLNNWLISYKIKKKLAGVKKTEREAVSFLNIEGYKVTDIQKKKKITIYIDGKPYSNYVQADFMVRKNSKKYIVEIKKGEKNRATNAVVRRQLLEYYLVYNPDGILLLDLEKRKIKQIEFEWKKSAYSMKGILISAVLGCFLGLLLWYLITV